MKKIVALMAALAFSGASHALTGQEIAGGVLIAGAIGGIVAAATSGDNGTTGTTK